MNHLSAMKVLRTNASAGVLVALTLLFASPAGASVSIGSKENIQVGGFFSQGWLKSSGNNYPFAAKDGTFDFREMAVNVSTTFGSHLRVGAQGFAQTLGNYGEDRVMLDWAVADYNFRQEFGVRAGRIKYPKGLYGEALDLDVVRPFIFLPLSLYNPVLRDFSSSFDGAMVYGSINAGRGGSLDYKVFTGDIRMDTRQGVADFFNTTNLYKNGVTALGLDHLVGASADWTTPVEGLKVHLSYSALKNVTGSGLFAPVPFPLPVNVKVERMGYATLGLEYAHHDWTLAGEFQRQGGHSVVAAPPVMVNRGDYGSDNWYVSAARRFGGRFEAGAYYSVSRNRFAAAGTPRQDRESRDTVLSLRCDLNEHVTVKIEGHYVDGRYNVFNTVRTPNPVIGDHTSFFAAKTTLSF